MSVSVDNAKIEAVMQFATFLDVLKDPESLKNTLGQLQQAIVDNTQLVEAKTKLDGVDSFVSAEKDKIQAAYDKLQKDTEALEKKVLDQIASEKQFSDDMSTKADTQATKQKALDSMNEALIKWESDLNKKDIAVQLAQDAVDKRSSELDAKEADLTDKAAKLKAVFGG